MCPRLRYIGAILSLGFTPFVMTITECAIQGGVQRLPRPAQPAETVTIQPRSPLRKAQRAAAHIAAAERPRKRNLSPLSSWHDGKGDEVRLKKGRRYATVIAFVFCLTSSWSKLSTAMPQICAHLFSASESVTEIVGKYCPLFRMGSIMFFVQMTLRVMVNVALGQARSALLLAVTRKVVILIPLCFFLTHVFGFRGVYMSEGIADFAAAVITSES